MAQPCYKFLSKAYIPSLLRGEIRIGRLIYYQLLEVVYQDQWIGDVTEGRAMTPTGHIEISPERPNPDMRQRLENIGVAKVAGDGTLMISDSQLVSQVDCYVFCFSRGLLEELVPVMCRPDKFGNSYDGCVKIAGLESLAHIIWKTGVIGAVPIRELFRLDFKPILYEPYEYDFKAKGLTFGNPFKKDNRYSSQQEVRIAFFPKFKAQDDFFTVKTRISERDIAEQPIKLLAAKRTNAILKPNLSEGQYIAVLRDFIFRWQQYGVADQTRLDKSEVGGAMARDEFIEQELRRRSTKENLFERRRQSIVDAYWGLRGKYPSPRLDHLFVAKRDMSAVAMYVKIYLSRVQDGLLPLL